MFYFQIFMSDKIDMVISVALPPVASLSAPMLVAKNMYYRQFLQSQQTIRSHPDHPHGQSRFSVEGSSIGKRKADGIFYCIDVFRNEAEAVVMQLG